MKKTVLLFLMAMALGLSPSAQTLKRSEKKALKQIETHISYLASDNLEGRATGSPGEKLSAEYIASEFKKIGAKPGGNNGTYFQNFSIVSLRMAKDSCELRVNGIPFRLFVDFYPVSLTSNKKSVDSKLVNVDYGINAPELEYNDYKDKVVKGKIVLINIGTPDSQSVHSKFMSYLPIESRVKTAIEFGAVGVIFVNKGDPKNNPSGELSKTIKPTEIPVFFSNRAEMLYVPNAEIPIFMNSNIFTISETGHNVIGKCDNKAKYTVIIGAHHDHLGRGEIKGSRELNSTEIHNGADDNASGTSAIIELTKLLKKRKYKKFNYVIIAFSGEEMGLVGSKYFVENPLVDMGKVSYMINLDMVGRLKNTLVINGTGTSPFWDEAITTLRQDSSRISKIKTTESGIGASDHTSFYLAGIPSIHFFTGQHDDYHKPTDDIGTLNLKGEIFVMSKILDLIKLSPKDKKLDYTKTKDTAMKTSFKVTLGIMPDYVFDGEGVRIDGVRDGKPASNAGMLKGDVIINLAGTKVDNIETYMKVLNKIEPGSKVEVIYIREGKATTTEVQF